ncbi:hypothetical protein [Amycolatopsis sp. BJA-103]|uniref:hypothetical protein n=1 Tax=unclassified Amycolatopsis TaxID=2618356 RepID=UPI000C77FED4|nr:hypothetical protein [Amycolatopsis sp. BJA-103]AUI59131.1 hypothetical protein BKN51_13535 [Amycolatopsis sp. BJA-103]PNE17421.1 hypothetical protein B1H26_20990 [Amycolatopsis sp. BJA-103]
MVSALDADSPIATVFGAILMLVVGAGLLAVVLIVASKMSGRRERRHWMAGFAAEVSGTFHSEHGKTSPGFGVDPVSLERPLAEAAIVRCVEFRYRDHDFVGVDYLDDRHQPGGDSTPRAFHSVQLRVPESAPLFVSADGAFPTRVMREFEQVKTFDRDFDGAVKVRAADRERAAELLTQEVRDWLRAETRLTQWPVYLERATLRTGGQRPLTRETLLAEADYLIDVSGRLPTDRF